MKRNILLLIFAIIFTIVFIEIALSFAGWIYHKAHIKLENYEVNKEEREFKLYTEAENMVLEDEKLIKVLCLGDSWTFGLGAPIGYSYPVQLQKILEEEHPNSYRVYNGGIPGYTSTVLLKYLPKFIDKYKPNIVVILIGMNDIHNPMLSEITNLPNKNLNEKVLPQLINFITESHIYKILKLGLFELQRRFGFKERKYRILKPIVNQQSIDFFQRGVEFYNHNNNYEAGEYWLKKAIDIDQNNYIAYIKLAQIYEEMKRFDNCLDTFNNLIKLNPNDEIKGMLYCDLFRMYQLSDTPRKRITEIIKQITTTENFKNPGEPFLLNEKILRENLANNLSKIVEFIKSRNMVVTLQVYPNGDNKDIVKTISEKYNIPYIDHHRILSAAINVNDYFSEIDNRHPNGKGYHLMASNIYRMLKNLAEYFFCLNESE